MNTVESLESIVDSLDEPDTMRWSASCLLRTSLVALFYTHIAVPNCPLFHQLLEPFRREVRIPQDAFQNLGMEYPPRITGNRHPLALCIPVNLAHRLK